MLLFGGCDENFSAFGDTWICDFQAPRPLFL